MITIVVEVKQGAVKYISANNDQIQVIVVDWDNIEQNPKEEIPLIQAVGPDFIAPSLGDLYLTGPMTPLEKKVGEEINKIWL